MKRKYTIGVFGQGAAAFADGLEAYAKWLQEKSNELARRLAEHGVISASMDFSRAFYQGPKDVSVKATQIGPSHYKVEANGEAVLFLEFGSGYKYGDGHKLAHELGFGPGTWPDKHYSYDPAKNKKVANWENTKGWYLPKDKGGGHTMGNPPSAAMYNSVKTTEEDLEQIVREVFSE